MPVKHDLQIIGSRRGKSIQVDKIKAIYVLDRNSVPQSNKNQVLPRVFEVHKHNC